MSKIAKMTLFGLVAASCTVKKLDNSDNRTGSSLKAVSINQPKFRETMDKDLSPELSAEADELIKNLVVQISAEPLNCTTGVTAEKRDFGEKKVSEAVIDSTYKFRKGCDYIIKLVYLDSSDNSIILASDGKTINLTKSELESAKPVAKVQLMVTVAGRKFWSRAPLLETPSDADAEIQPNIDNGAVSLDVPSCPEITSLTKETAVKCANDYRNFYISAASDFQASSWYASYSDAAYKVETLQLVDLSDAIAKSKLCKSVSSNRDKVSQLISTFDTAPLSDSEKIFKVNLAEVTSKKYEPLTQKTVQLLGCP